MKSLIGLAALILAIPALFFFSWLDRPIIGCLAAAALIAVNAVILAKEKDGSTVYCSECGRPYESSDWRDFPEDALDD